MTEQIALFVDHSNNRSLVEESLRDDYELLLEQDDPLESNPDLILLDWNGYQRREQDVKQYKDERINGGDKVAVLPVVLLARESELSRARKQLRGPVDDMLLIPLPRDLFRTRLENLLTQRRLSVELKQFNETLQQRVQQKTRTIREREENIVFKLVTASTHRDEETGAHIKRLGLSAEVMAEELGWDQDRVNDIRLAATMHDIGKIGIPDGILQKPGDLTDDEFETMQSHTKLGAEIIGDTDVDLLKMARDIAWTHHEQWDGSGYPRGLSGEDIPAVGRLVAIVDVYDALTHDRVYRDAMPEEKALGIIEEDTGSHFEPAMYECFRSVLPELREIRDMTPEDDISLT